MPTPPLEIPAETSVRLKNDSIPSERRSPATTSASSSSTAVVTSASAMAGILRLEPDKAAESEARGAVPLHDHRQQRLAVAAAQHRARRLRLRVDVAGAERVDRAAARAPAARRRQLRHQQLRERSRQRVSVQPPLFAHPVPPVAPKRSVLIRAGSWPSPTRASATASTKPVGPQTKVSGRCETGHAT